MKISTSQAESQVSVREGFQKCVMLVDLDIILAKCEGCQ